MVSEGLDAAYSAISLRDDLGQLTGYRGDDFDWEACLAAELCRPQRLLPSPQR